jgi:outer membrane protein OmpA-like peptidoglycan-associated protein
MRRTAFLAGLIAAGAAGAAEIPLPEGAVLAAEEAAPFAMVELPEGPWAGGPPPVVSTEGAVTRRAWRIPGEVTPDALLVPIREALAAEGYSLVYACADRDCGGYDFRFALDLLPAPAMFVDLGNYRYLLTEDGSGARVAVVTSKGGGTGFVHVTAVTPGAPPPVPSVTATEEAPAEAPAAPPATDVAARLLAEGHAALEGLAFPSGSPSLPDDRYDSLAALAAFLEANPSATILLVGHTDAVGALEANLALSRARAEAVRTRLIGTYGIDGARLRAEGAGYLAPVASHLTPEGQAANRRVEAVLLSGP